MRPTHKIFFAIPFDAATRAMYERVANKVREHFPKVSTVIGNQEVGPSPEYSSIASFRAQNKDLAQQFTAQIRDSDVIVADLSHNNPNVHIELGIALTENKNILRVTGRALTELGFDIRNLEVFAYKDESAVTAKVLEYLRMFFRIKGLELSPENGDLYYRLPDALRLEALKSQFALTFPMPPHYTVRDGLVKVTFEILDVQTDADWFGIYLRSGPSPFPGSYLVYVRRSGSVEVGLYPGPQIIEEFKLPGKAEGKQTMVVEFENNRLTIRVAESEFSSNVLWHQSAGRIAFAAWQSDVILHAAESISRDTVEWP